MIVWLHNAIYDDSIPLIHPDDHGFVTGDGVFETVAVRDGQPFALTRHLARLERSAQGMGIPVAASAVRAAAEELLAAPGAPRGLARLRITLTGGRAPLSSDRGDGEPTLLVALQAATVPPETSDVVLVPWARNDRGATAGLKTTSYAENVLALRYAHDRGGSEAVFPNTKGRLCEGTGTNVFVAHGGRLLTPPLSSGCLAGVTRALLLEWVAEAEEADLSPEDLRGAPEAFLVSTMRDVQPVRSVDGAALPAAPGRLSRRAAEVFAERARANQDP